MAKSVHLSVMPNEVLEGLAIKAGQTIVDGTLGGGGHTRLIADKVGPDGLVISLDRDVEAVERATNELSDLPVQPVHANFCNLPEVIVELEIERVDGLVLDLGLSSDQLADADRGFSFHAEGPLDLRFDSTRGEPAYGLVQRLSERHLADLIFNFGEERHSRRIARLIVQERQQRELRSAKEIADVIRKAIPGPRQRIDGATRTFQALRIAVNEELKSLDIALRRIPECLHAGARVAIISFHSLEDRMVKEAFRENPGFATISRKPIRPTDGEVAANPRSRSAKLRVAEIAGDTVS